MKKTEESMDELVDQTLSIIPILPKKLFSKVQLLQEEDLHPTHFHILHLVEQEEALRMSEIAQKLTIKKSNLTPLVYKLIEKNLIIRKKGKKDRRVTFIELTEQGKSFLAEKKVLMENILKERLSSLTDEDQHKLYNAFTDLSDVLSKLED
ncbi:MarR family winged helix-turn-helix transcriptional regulator [Halobacillus sp. MO56]